MMSKKIVDVLPETFSSAMSGSVCGQVFMRIDGEAFPAEAWNDFVVYFLWELSEATSKILRDASRRAVEEVSFREGPYFVEISWAAKGTLLVRGMYRGDAKVERIRMLAEVGEFVEDLMTSSEAAWAQIQKLERVDPNAAWYEKSITDLRDAWNCRYGSV